jgi:hypothetical protein
LKELYSEFKKQHPTVNIGMSIFFQLRPKWCVLVGASGMDAVCVCTIHQKVEMMMPAGINLSKDHIEELIEKMVCVKNNRDCMLKSAKNVRTITPIFGNLLRN